MYCPKCGAVNEDGTVQCGRCGAAITPTAVPGEAPKVPNYLVPAILATLFCCMPFGIVAIVYAAISMGRNSSGDFAGATEAARTAKTWCWVSFGVGLAWVLVWAAFVAFGALAGAAQ